MAQSRSSPLTKAEQQKITFRQPVEKKAGGFNVDCIHVTFILNLKILISHSVLIFMYYCAELEFKCTFVQNEISC